MHGRGWGARGVKEEGPVNSFYKTRVIYFSRNVQSRRHEASQYSVYGNFNSVVLQYQFQVRAELKQILWVRVCVCVGVYLLCVQLT